MKRLFAPLLVILALLAPALPTQAVQLSSMGSAEASISSYYQDIFSIEGLPYHDPTVVWPTKEHPYSNDYCTGGEPVYANFVAFYCPDDETIVLEKSVMDQWGARDSFIPMFVMAHEWGHHIQKLEGIDTPWCNVIACAPIDPGDWDLVYSIELEQMADCLAGSWMAYLEGENVLNDSDISNLVYFMALTLDGGGVGTGPGEHGSAPQRIDAALRGFHHGIYGCMTLNPLDGVPTPDATPVDPSH